MWLVVLGVVLLALKLSGMGWVANWSWWLVLAPFGLAALYWQLADGLGWTQRAAMRRQDERVKQRRNERLDALGLRHTPRQAGADRDPTHPKPADDTPASRPPAA